MLDDQERRRLRDEISAMLSDEHYLSFESIRAELGRRGAPELRTEQLVELLRALLAQELIEHRPLDEDPADRQRIFIPRSAFRLTPGGADRVRGG